MFSWMAPPRLGFDCTLFCNATFAPFSCRFLIFALIFEKLSESLMAVYELFEALPCLYTLMFMPRPGIACMFELREGPTPEIRPFSPVLIGPYP